MGTAGVCVTLADGVVVGEELIVAEVDAEAVMDPESDTVTLDDSVLDDVSDCVLECDAVRVGEGVMVGELDQEELGDSGPGDALPVGDTVTLLLIDMLAVTVALSDVEAVAERDCDGDALPVSDTVTLLVIDMLAVAVALSDVEAVAERDCDGVCDRDCDTLGVGAWEPEAVEVMDADPVLLGVVEVDGVKLGVGETDAVGPIAYRYPS